MRSVYVRWNDISFDLQLDQYSSNIVEEKGNKGIGLIVFVCCAIAVLLPSSITVVKICNGTATGHPIAAIIAVFLLLGLPIYWSVNQYFLKRSFVLRDKQVFFTFARLFQKKKVTMKIEEYVQIEFGKTRSQSSEECGIGSIGRYFVRLAHEDTKYTIDLYEQAACQMSPARLERYSQIFTLPVVDVTPKITEKDKEFAQMTKAFLAKRNKMK